MKIKSSFTFQNLKYQNTFTLLDRYVHIIRPVLIFNKVAQTFDLLSD